MLWFRRSRRQTRNSRRSRRTLRLELLDDRLPLAAETFAGLEFLSGATSGEMTANGTPYEIAPTDYTITPNQILNAGNKFNNIASSYGMDNSGVGIGLYLEANWPPVGPYALPTVVNLTGAMSLIAAPHLAAEPYESYREQDGAMPVVIAVDDWSEGHVREEICDLGAISCTGLAVDDGKDPASNYQVIAKANEQKMTDVSHGLSTSLTFHNTLALAKYRDQVDVQIDLDASLHRAPRVLGETRFVGTWERSQAGVRVRAFGLNLTASSTIITSTRSAEFTYYVDDSAGWLASEGLVPKIQAYWASGPRLEDRISGPEGLAQTLDGENTPGFHRVSFSADVFSQAPEYATHVLFYIDPDNQILETAEYLNFSSCRFVPELALFAPYAKVKETVDNIPVLDPATIDPHHLLLSYFIAGSTNAHALPVQVTFYAIPFDPSLPEVKLGFGFTLSPSGIQAEPRVKLVQDPTGHPTPSEILDRGVYLLKLNPNDTALQGALEDASYESVVARLEFNGHRVSESPFFGVYQAPKKVLTDTNGNPYTRTFPIVSRARAQFNETISVRQEQTSMHAEFDLGFGPQGKGELSLDIPPWILMIGANGNDHLLFDETVYIPITAKAGEGNDLIIGGTGADELNGGEGNDVLIGEGWSTDWHLLDAMFSAFDGGELTFMAGLVPWNSGANDTIVGGAGIDLLIGGGGDDTLESGSNNGFVFGDSFQFTWTESVAIGFDGLSFLATVGFALKGNGKDTITGGDNSDLVIGGGGNDTIVGKAGSIDWLAGNDGDDTIQGGDGFNVLVGGAGNDIIDGGNNGNFILGDSLVVDSFKKLSVDDLAKGHFVLGVGIFPEGTGNDEITGGTGFDFILGGDGNDKIDDGGGDGWNVVFCDAFSVTVGAGFDLELDDFTGHSWLLILANPLTWWQLFTSISAEAEGQGNDVYHGAESVDVVIGGGGDDQLYGKGGNDFLIGGDGNDVVDAGWDEFYNDGDVAFGGPGNDTLYGSGGNDWLESEEGDDQFYGGNGNDHIDGGPGNDRLYGGPGNDTLNGEEGDDTFYFDTGSDGITGGTGRDSLSFVSGTADLASLQAYSLVGVDVFDLSDAGIMTLTLKSTSLPMNDLGTVVEVLSGPEDRFVVDEPWTIVGSQIDSGRYLVELSLGGLNLWMGNQANWQNPIRGMDVNGSGDISPLDALLVINELNGHVLSDANGVLPDIGTLATLPRTWLDVNGDDHVHPLDALLVINYLNAQSVSGESLSSPWDEKIRREALRRGYWKVMAR